MASTVFFLLQALTASYFTYFALVPLLIVGLAEWRRARVPLKMMVRHFAPAAALVLVVMLPVARAYYVVRGDTGQRRSDDEIRRHSADIGDYFSAAPRLRLWGGLGTGRGEHELFPGAAVLGLAALALIAGQHSPPDCSLCGRPGIGVRAVARTGALGVGPPAWRAWAIRRAAADRAGARRAARACAPRSRRSGGAQCARRVRRGVADRSRRAACARAGDRGDGRDRGRRRMGGAHPHPVVRLARRPAPRIAYAYLADAPAGAVMELRRTPKTPIASSPTST